ncbi:hypothetical protein J2045_001497 [Peteryoungia aggregata LMG 23059]|uniref:Uncharacterized protein n=1 Tax=Peteryoungia aggregata LMG 23059 TaxID=1368425 RepID=A0ABU0G5B8_9HYPH|nr:hypothetical protein [Peteryoungia aggregata]MDQ0420478.1 hypothetical protein [Peteryoungia aggregata LMG 23059]
MNTAPITTWEGAEAYFTFANSPGILMLLSLIGAGLCVWTIVSMAKHENDCYKKM